MTGALAGALVLNDRMIGTGLCAQAALDALLLIDMRFLPAVEVDSVALTGVLAAMRDAAAANRRHVVARNRAFVAGDIQRFDDIRILLAAAHRELHPFAEDGSFLIDATAHGGLFARHDRLWDIQQGLLQRVVKRALCNLAERAVFKILHLVFELSHRDPFLAMALFRGGQREPFPRVGITNWL
ncbi:hypothetical protein SDC9_111211 [bioreactor metagenome]|uniref:Uncharacterized protein n=1 Tax=bioreactor metagenome TaxID=1076179 RepID=A0A645BFW1_9ZZZZ